METDQPENQSDAGLADQHKGPGEGGNSEGSEFHDDGSGGEASSILDTEKATADRFYARLRSDLTKRGLHGSVDGNAKHPPCFATQAAYEGWLANASLVGAMVPYRYDAPAVPNYCYDCRAAFKREMLMEGRCQFPGTRFEPVQIVVQEGQRKAIEVTIVGVSRSEERQVTKQDLDEFLR